MMDKWQLYLAFNEPLTDPDVLFEIIEDVRSAGLILDRLDNVEPVRRPCSRDTLAEILQALTPDAPCRAPIGRGPNGTYLIVRACEPTTSGEGSANLVQVIMRPTKRLPIQLFVELGRRYLKEGRVAYACVDRDETILGQHSFGTINDRLPGVFWMNMFGPAYVDALGASLALAPWDKTEELTNGAVIARVYESPLAPPQDLWERRAAVRSALGEEKFVAKRWSNQPKLGLYGRFVQPRSSHVPSEPTAKSQPADLQLTARMEADAEICARNAVMNGFELDYTQHTLPALDSLLQSLTPWSDASSELRDGMVRLLGAYFGEVLRRESGGFWVSDPTYQVPAVLLSNGLKAFPHSSVAKRWQEGQIGSLTFLFSSLSAIPTIDPR
jgi:hypothetical protein